MNAGLTPMPDPVCRSGCRSLVSRSRLSVRCLPSVCHLVLLALVALEACGGRDVIVAQGTVEVEETDLAATATGRVARIQAEEGQQVSAGDTLVVLHAVNLPAELEAYRARVTRSRAELTEAERGARAEDIEAAEATLRGAEAEVDRTGREYERMEGLGKNAVVSQQDVDRARTAWQQAQSRRDAARATLQRLQHGSRQEEIAAARARLAEAQAALASLEATQGDLVLVAPGAGVVLPRYVEVGELLQAGRPALTLADLSRPWVRVYVAEGDLPFIHLGDTASVTVDALPDSGLNGTVVAIAHQAEFTPKVALTEDERRDLVFGVKVDLRGHQGLLRAGLPVTVRFSRERR